MLHHARDPDLVAVGEAVHVHLDGVLEEAVQQHVVAGKALEHVRHVVRDLVFVDRDAHALPAQHVARPHERRVADPLCHGDGFFDRLGHAVVRKRNLQLLEQRGELAAVLGQVHVRVGRPEDGHAGLY